LAFQELEALCGTLVLDEENKVKEALCPLMMAHQGLAKMVRTVRKDVYKRVVNGVIVNMELLFTSAGAKLCILIKVHHRRFVVLLDHIFTIFSRNLAKK